MKIAFCHIHKDKNWPILLYLPVHLIARGEHVFFFFILVLCLLGNRLWCNLKPLLSSLYLIQRQDSHHYGYPSDVENVSQSLMAANRARSPFNPISSSAQRTWPSHCGQSLCFICFY